VAASNNRDHEITLVITISKYCQLFTSFTSIIRGNSPRSLHRNRSIIACLRHIYMGLFFTHILFVMNRTMNATPTERLQHHFRYWHAYKQKVWQILQDWRNLSTFPSQLNALKSKRKFCHTVQSPREGAFVGLVPPKQSFKPPPNWNIRHYKTVMLVQILECQAPLHKCEAPPIEDFLVTVLLARQAVH